MTETQRAAMRQALEALEFFRGTAICDADTKVADEGITAGRAALSEPEPEPVAWMDRFGSVVVGKGPYETFTTPLYTTPPARRPLTDEEIEDIWNEYCDELGEASINDAIDIGRAIERAHGITGGNDE